MNFSESTESEQSSFSDWSNSSWLSNSSDFSVFVDDSKDNLKRISPEKLRYTAQQLAEMSASHHFPIFATNSPLNKCAKLHWACLVGWCLCKYQYQPLTPLHLLPITPLTDYQVLLEAAKIRSKVPLAPPEGSLSNEDAQQQKSKIEPRKISPEETQQNVIYEYETTV